MDDKNIGSSKQRALRKQIDKEDKTRKDKYQKLSNKLKSFGSLSVNWDGYNGLPPSSEMINCFHLFLSELFKLKIDAPVLQLTGEGNIGCFWKAQTGYAEIEFDSPGQYCYFLKDDDGVFGKDDCIFDSFIDEKLIEYIKKIGVKNGS